MASVAANNSNPLPEHFEFTPIPDEMAYHRQSPMDADPIEQFPETSRTSPADPIEQFTEKNRRTQSSGASGSVMPLAQYIEGVDPNSEEGRAKKQQRRLYEDTSTQGTLEIVAFKRAAERTGVGRLRRHFPNSSDAELAVIWRQQLTGQDVDEEGLPVTLRGRDGTSVVDDEHRRTIGRVEHDLQFFNADHSVTIHGSSLDCTFCGKLFPIYYMLSINPYGVDDWCNVHNRCCYQCATCANDDYVWYSERSNLSPAKLGERGHLGDRHFDQLDRSGLYDRDDDRETKPPGWHLATQYDHTYFPKVYFDNFWDTTKCRWVRKPTFLRKNGMTTASIGIVDWYQLCQKVNVFRKRLRQEAASQRSASWKQMCDDIEKESRAHIRREVRARILRLTDIFVADLARLLDDHKKQMVMRAFFEWEQTSIAKSLDPDWDADKFWDMASREATLTDWLYKVTESIDQHFVCRSKACASVIHNHHWLRQISWGYPIASQHGRYSCPRCLTGYRPWALRNTASSTNAPTFVPAQKALIINGEGMTAPDSGSDGGDYLLFLMEWEKKDDDALVGKLKQIMAGLRRDFGTKDIQSKLVGALRDEQMKHQKPAPLHSRLHLGPR